MKQDAEYLNSSFTSEEQGELASKELVHNLLRLIRIAIDRRTTLVQALCVGTVLGALYYALAPRYYQSSAKLLIVQRTNDQQIGRAHV